MLTKYYQKALRLFANNYPPSASKAGSGIPFITTGGYTRYFSLYSPQSGSQTFQPGLAMPANNNTSVGFYFTEDDTPYADQYVFSKASYTLGSVTFENETSGNNLIYKLSFTLNNTAGRQITLHKFVANSRIPSGENAIPGSSAGGSDTIISHIEEFDNPIVVASGGSVVIHITIKQYNYD